MTTTMNAPGSDMRFPDPEDLIEPEPDFEFLSDDAMDAMEEAGGLFFVDEMVDDLMLFGEVSELNRDQPFGWDMADLMDWDSLDGECAYDN